MDNFNNCLNNIANLLKEWLVSKEYIINSDDDLITQTKMFILRYRRIIGIIIIIILLYIGLNCDLSNENYLQKGGSGITVSAKTMQSVAKAEAKAAKTAEQAAKTAAKKAEKAAEAEEKVVKTQAKALMKQERKDEKKTAFKAMRQEKINELQNKYNKTALGRLSVKSNAGFSKKAILGKSIYNVGSYAGEKFKEFSGWLYQILFAIAISIAICMVVLPSLSFFIIGIICFFLLKSKISGFKSL